MPPETPDLLDAATDPLALDPEAVLAAMPATEEAGAWEGSLGEMLDITAAALARVGERSDRARDLAAAAISALASAMGGRVFYLPKGDRLKAALRDRAMWSAYDGKPETVERLAKQHGVTVISAYRILARQRELHRRKTQPGLF